MLKIDKRVPKGPSKIRDARPDDPIFNRGYVIGGQPPKKPRRQPERPEAEELARLIQTAPVTPDRQQ